MTKDMVKVKKQLEERGKHVAELEKWTAALNLNGVQNDKAADKTTLTNTVSGQQHPEVCKLNYRFCTFRSLLHVF